MDECLVDLSLFSMSPTNDHHFTTPEIPEIPPYQQALDEALWGSNPRGVYHRMPSANAAKPPPRRPRRKVLDILPDNPREAYHPSRCFISRMKRLRLDSHAEQGNFLASALQQRRRVPPTPALVLPAAAPENQGRPACPMIWLPDEQMWLVADADGGPYDTSPPITPPPLYNSPGHPYATSEPSPRRYGSRDRSPPRPATANPAADPVRSQFMTLMEANNNNATASAINPPRTTRYPEDRLPPSFQEAMTGVTMHQYHEYVDLPSRAGSTTHSGFKPSYAIIQPRNSRVDSISITSDTFFTGSRRESWHSTVAPVSPLSARPESPTLGAGIVGVQRSKSARSYI